MREDREREFRGLPLDCIASKTIKGTKRYYRQWVEDGRTRSEYLAADGAKCAAVEKLFCSISSRTVLYRGPDFDHASGIRYRNDERYLRFGERHRS